jgi:hypothetical protein
MDLNINCEWFTCAQVGNLATYPSIPLTFVFDSPSSQFRSSFSTILLWSPPDLLTVDMTQPMAYHMSSYLVPHDHTLTLPESNSILKAILLWVHHFLLLVA